MKRGQRTKIERPDTTEHGPNRRRSEQESDPRRTRSPWVSRGAVLGVLRIVASMAFVAGLVGGGYLIYRHASASSYFAATDIRVSGNRTVTAVEIVEAAQLTGEPNLFQVDAVLSREQLLAHPWIADARISTRLPRTVSIEVVERRAAATLVLEVPYLVDESGEVFKRFTSGDAVVAPLVTGFEREDFSSDKAMAGQRLRDALDLSRRYRKSSLEQTAPLAEVHREPDGGFSLVIGDDGVYVRLGRGPFRHKLQRLATLLSRLQRDGRAPAVVYLDNEVRPDRITVTPRPLPGESAALNKASNEQKRLSKI